jgi:hypothetical protein
VTAVATHRRPTWLRYVAVGVVATTLSITALALPSKLLLGLLAFLILGALIVRAKGDAVLVLLILVTTMAIVPANLTVSALGSVGTPTVLLGLFAGVLWFVLWLAPSDVEEQHYRAIPLLLVVFVSAMVASYAAAATRPKDALEAAAADRGMLFVLAGVSAGLLAAECIRTRERLETLIKGIVLAGVGIASVGIVQFLFGWDPATDIQVPGLTNTVDGALFVTERAEFRRVAGIMLHPIEFGVVMCMVLPLALHLGFRRSRAWLLAAAVIAVAMPMSVSRTAALGVIALLIVLVPSWSRQVRRRFYAAVLAYLVTIRLLVPGLLNEMVSLFTEASSDPSVQSRQVDYAYVTKFIEQRPVFGRGFGTFIPTRYDFLDNQYLLGLVETGYVGVAAFLVLIFGSIFVAGLIRSRAGDENDRSLATALMASLLVVAVTSVAFDFMGFPTVRMLLFLLVGCVGALWRLYSRTGPDTDSPSADRAPAPSVVRPTLQRTGT